MLFIFLKIKNACFICWFFFYHKHNSRKKKLIVFVDFETREKEDMQPAHIINIDIQDNHEEATIGAFLISDLATMVGFYKDFSWFFICVLHFQKFILIVINFYCLKHLQSLCLLKNRI